MASSASLGLAGVIARTIDEDRPALEPPPGVTSNFDDPYSRGPVLVTVSSILIPTMLLFVIARLYAKFRIIRELQWDDLTCGLATLGAVAYFIGANILVRQNIGKHQWDVRAEELQANRFLISTYVVNLLPPPTFLCVKLSFFLLYLQIFHPLRVMKWCIYVGGSFTFCWHLTTTIIQLVYSTPSSGESWLSRSQAQSNGQFKAMTLSIPRSAVGAVIDLVILVIPIVAVSQLQMPMRRKLGLILVFMTGASACLSSLLSLYFRTISTNNSDATWNLLPIMVLLIVEACVGIICSCIPAVMVVIRHHLPQYTALKKFLASHFKIFQSLRSQSKSPQSKPTIQQNRQSMPLNDHLQDVQFETDKGDSSASSQASFTRTHVKTVSTYIGTTHGKGSQIADRDIHLTHDLEQNWSEVDDAHAR